jgi:CRISPR-associated protein Cas2
MWLLVLFDLPVMSLAQIRAYSHFRKSLKAVGFQMLQKSVYLMFCGERDHADAIRNQVVSLLPPEGSVRIQTLAPQAMDNMLGFLDGAPTPPLPQPEQSLVF